MKYYKLTQAIIIFSLLLGAQALHAKDELAIRSYADRNEIAIGDRIEYTIEVSGFRGTELQMPDFKSNVIGEFEIKDFNSKISNGWFGRKTLRSRYYITAYTVGNKEIPAFDIKYKLKADKDWQLKKTKAININIVSVLPKEMPSDIKDIKGPAYYFEMNWPLIISVIALLSIFIAAITLIRKFRNRKPVLLPHETALEELEAARNQLINTGDIKAYFVGISDSIRHYIERVFSLKAPEMTSDEFLNSLRDSTALTVPQKELLRGFMNACDLVKFAKYTPTGTEAEDLYLTAKRFVEETRGNK